MCTGNLLSMINSLNTYTIHVAVDALLNNLLIIFIFIFGRLQLFRNVLCVSVSVCVFCLYFVFRRGLKSSYEKSRSFSQTNMEIGHLIALKVLFSNTFG